MFLPLLASLALADSITLDTGMVVEGDLARYELGGDCQLSVTEGGLAGVILIVPCHRIESFQRTIARRPVPVGLEEEAGRLGGGVPAAPVAEAAPSLQAPAATALVEAAPVVAVAEESVPGTSLPAGPLAEPDGDAGPAAAVPFYDEPLFPVDATTPVVPGAAGPAGALAPSAPTPAPQTRSLSF